MPFDIGSPVAARDAGLRFVHQNLGLIDALDVADNFCLEGGDAGVGKLDRRAERARARAAIERLGFDIEPDARWCSTLAASERTAIAVARALADTGTGVPAARARRADGVAARPRGRPAVRRAAPRRRRAARASCSSPTTSTRCSACAHASPCSATAATSPRCGPTSCRTTRSSS